jgi:NADH-quinone oxidoreductase subunit M
MGHDVALTLLILVPFLGGVLALVSSGKGERERWVSLASLVATFAILVHVVGGAGEGQWMARFHAPWAPSVGVSIVFALDGLSAALVAITAILGIIGVMASWHEIRESSGLFHLCLCWIVSASIGVFLSFDLLVFAFFWEAMIVPSFMMIAIWGHGDREAAALKFLIFNAVAGLGLLAAVFALAALADHVTFDAFELAGMRRNPTVQVWLLLGFALAFLVKLPAVPFHAWLADAHTQAPTAGSILLAGVLLKTGAYGLLRFPPMLFADGMAVLAPYGLVMGAIGGLYAGIVACGQHDAKRLVAYTSIAHMCIVLMGVCAGVRFALVGASVEMVAHSFSASALFLLIGALYERTGTRDLRKLGGLQQAAPRFAAAFSLFFAAALAMPGTANFLGEALVLVGLFEVNWPLALAALATLIVSVVYATRLLRGLVFGEPRPAGPLPDLTWRELGPAVVLAGGTMLFGLYPAPLIAFVEPAIAAALRQLAP